MEDNAVTCPNCGRSVEAGFRFCDGCGTRLESSATIEEPKQDEPPPVATETRAPITPEPPKDRPALPSAEPKRGFGDRLAGVRGRFKRDKDKALVRREAPALRKARVVTPVSTATETKLPPAWRPVEQQLAKPERTEAGFRYPLRYGIHLIAAFVVGVLVLAIVAAVAALVTNGSVAVLRVRGLPILLAAGTAIVVFALLRTSRRASVARSDQRTREVGAILIGFVVLLAACALVARPVTADAAQARIERTLRVFGPADRDAVSSFQGDIDEWNVVEAEYQRAVADVVRDKTPNLRRFQRRATRGDDLLRELATRMETHAGQASNPRLRDGLSDLAAVYQDRFAGLRLVERGILSNDFTLVPVGDETFKRARTRARALFRRELGTLIEQAGGDAATFGRSLSP